MPVALFTLTPGQLDTLTVPELFGLPVLDVPPFDFVMVASVVTTPAPAASSVVSPSPTASVVASPSPTASVVVTPNPSAAVAAPGE